jgi:hypothetical protein
MRGLKRFRSASVIAAGHAFVQNLRCGHYELAPDSPAGRRVAMAFTELALAIGAGFSPGPSLADPANATGHCCIEP